jgi:adenylosuccinate lyase
VIPRYTREEMGQIWTDWTRFQIWMEVELAAAEAMAEEGLIPAEVAKKLRGSAWKIGEGDVEEILKIESVTRHDVIAFLTHLERRMGPEARYLHMGMTSSDVLDTTLAVQLKRACDLLLKDVDDLHKAVRGQAQKYKNTIMVGRTHGIHAEPTTFGLVLAIWCQELSRHKQRLQAAQGRIAVGKCSGAVGTFAHLPLSVEERVCQRLGLDPAPVSNQVVQRDRHAELFCTLANLGATIEKMAVNIRHFQRTEVGEVSESFKQGQRGSSAMPHKKNPIAAENLTGVARLLRSYAMAALENVALWHERDISHSSVERVIGPDATILCDYALARMTRIVSGMVVDQERMQQNLEQTGGLVYSQGVLLALVRAGMEREKAYEVVQKKALESWDAKKPLLDLLLGDIEVVDKLGKEGIERCFDPAALLSRTDEIFKRALGA